MSESQARRLTGLVLLLGSLALAVPLLPGLPAGSGFLLFHVAWPLLFFSAGLTGRTPWVVFVAGGALGVHGLTAGWSVSNWIATVAAGMSLALWGLDRALDQVLRQASNTGFAAFLARKRGNVLLLALPVAAVLFNADSLDGYAGGQLPILACGALYFLVAAVFRRRTELMEALAERWRIKLGITFVFSLILAIAHYRLNFGTDVLVPMQDWRRGIFCLSYAFLGWRWCYALYGWAVGAAGFGGRGVPR
ncbi:MAG: hypothetical protein ACKV2U_03125 [Bryobacteraceae bacterium]